MQMSSLRARLTLIGLTIGAVLLGLLFAGYNLASAATAAAGVQIQPAAASAQGARGSLVTYTLRLTNTGTAADTYTMTVSGYTWPTTFTVNGIGTGLLPLNPNQGQDIQVFVSIPLTATGHDVATFTAQSSDDPLVSASSTLTTSVLLKLYLPIVRE